ncbi:MAG: relaxase/mobilization nuclease domain-containing protein [Lachnospiraceae bacterium]|nr:relaxase/mobilization nuclease domain-containing protein [Lachnospiraceae bacterium]
MAITKMMHMKSSKSGRKGCHLKNAIDYILKEEKVAVENGYKYQATQGCLITSAYNDMIATKEAYGKTDGRQGYHFVISFRPGEVAKEQLWKITKGFVAEYLPGYEVVYALHDDGEHLHTHIIFNSVNYRSGYKYHYKDGDWEQEIQPIVDRLCMENDAPVLQYHVDEVEYNGEKKEIYHYSKYSKKINWTNIVKGDIDSCIDKSRSWEEFVTNMKELGYRFNFGKSVSIRKPGMGRSRRLKEKTMGFSYTPEGIIERIHFKTGQARLSTMPPALKGLEHTPAEVRTKVKYKKYKDMSFSDKVLVRQMLRIKNVIPAYQNYPGSFMVKRKADELQRASQELLVIKQYNIHSFDDIDTLYKEFSSMEKELKQNQKIEDFKMEQLQEVVNAYAILTGDESAEPENKDEKKKASEIIKKSPYDKETIDKYISEYEIASEKTNQDLKRIKKQKLALSRIKKKYGNDISDRKDETLVKEVTRSGRSRIN